MSSPLSDIASNDGSLSHLDSDRERILGSPPPTNGLKSPNGTAPKAADDSDLDPVQRLEHELQQTRDEKATLETQYRNLLAKLTTMRTTLGNKLKQDAVRGTHLLSSPPRLHQRLHRKNSTVRSSSCSS